MKKSVEQESKRRDIHTEAPSPSAPIQYEGVDAHANAAPPRESPTPRIAAFLYAAPYQKRKKARTTPIGADVPVNALHASGRDKIVQQQSAPKKVATDRLDKRHARKTPAAQRKKTAIDAKLLSDVVSQTSAIVAAR